MSHYKQVIELELAKATDGYLAFMSKGASMTDAEAIEANDLFDKYNRLRTILNELNTNTKPHHCV